MMKHYTVYIKDSGETLKIEGWSGRNKKEVADLVRFQFPDNSFRMIEVKKPKRVAWRNRIGKTWRVG
jgi:hypothetical protein